MDYPFYEICLDPLKTGKNKYIANCHIFENTGDSIIHHAGDWSVKQKEFNTEEEANYWMQINALRWLNKQGIKNIRIIVRKLEE